MISVVLIESIDFGGTFNAVFLSFSCSGEVVRCTLWNGYAQQFNDFLLQNNPNENVMAVIQHAKIKKWQGQYTVQNDKFGT
ncbi:putative nucleic acid-binding protein [Helianthus annuus]|nr:putative nucleic acid-binding protein [Helianthus annuus]